MSSITFKNFQIGIVDDPSIEDQGGFEFASGMDIFSEPGTIKATNAMTEVSYGAGASPADVPRWMVDTADGSNTRAYISAGSKILESTDGSAFNLFLTNANGANLGLEIFNDYVWYAAATRLGRAPVGNAAGKNDNFLTIDSDTEYHPLIRQGGSLKGGAGRYVFSVDEAGNLSSQALKLSLGYRVKSLAEHFTKLFAGTRFGASGGAITTQDASVFDWRGTVLATGSALPDAAYPLKMRGMNALISDGNNLYGFPDNLRHVYIFDGARFILFKKIFSNAVSVSSANPGAVSQHLETILYSGEFGTGAGVFQMKGNAFCQAYVPAVIAPGAGASINIGFVKSTFNGTVYIGYYNGGDGSYHIEKTSDNKQTGAFMRTNWHRIATDNLKRWQGVKLNMKTLASGCSVAVAYRTDKNASFTDSGYTVTSANQHLPVIFASQPRSREIQFKFTFTTSASNTPELLSYDPVFEVLKALR